MRVRTQGEEVLLGMTIKPFLSHKRENATAVGRLRDTLKIYGAGGWKDTEDLRVGERTREGIRRAIFEETGGLIWWGTRLALRSRFVNEVEIPTAFQRKDGEPLYPIVPLFIDLDPSQEPDREAIRASLLEHGDALLDCNGLVRPRGVSAEEFRHCVARRYLRDAVTALAAQGSEVGPDVTVAIRTLSEPSGQHDLTFDWRALLDAGVRSLPPQAGSLIAAALVNAREALQAAFPSAHLLLDLDLPLPLAFLVGYEWRITTRLRLSVRQRTGVSFADLNSNGDTATIPTTLRESLPANGAAVVVVSCLEGPGEMAAQYAARVGARELIKLHVPGRLGAPELRALARACARELRRLNNHGIDKHLLILGPSALAVFAGASANATGPVTIPFWDGSRYVDPIVVGAQKTQVHEVEVECTNSYGC